MDGVLVNAMPFHYKAMSTAIKEITDIDLDKKTFYLLEGMPVAEMALEIFRLYRYKGKGNNNEYSLAKKVAKRKKEVFMQMKVVPKPFDGARELIINDLSDCLKAIVSGAAKSEVETIMDEIFGKDKFSIIIDGDDFEGQGKPDPAPFKAALRKLGVETTPSSDTTIIVENAPLGIKAANAARIPCILTLNASPLVVSDFEGLISKEKIFKDTKSARNYLKCWAVA